MMRKIISKMIMRKLKLKKLTQKDETLGEVCAMKAEKILQMKNLEVTNQNTFNLKLKKKSVTNGSH